MEASKGIIEPKPLQEEQWYVIVDEKGEERSSGTVIAEKLPDGWKALPLDAAPDSSKEVWNKDAQQYEAKPVVAEPQACPACGRPF